MRWQLYAENVAEQFIKVHFLKQKYIINTDNKKLVSLLLSRSLSTRIRCDLEKITLLGAKSNAEIPGSIRYSLLSDLN